MHPNRAGRLVALLLAVTGTACHQSPPPEEPGVGIDEVVAAGMRNSFTPGAVVAVVMGDSVVFLRAYGTARFAGSEPMALDAVFPTGGLTPVVNGIAASALEAAGALDLDEPVGSYLPELPPELHAPSTAELLSHSGGLTAIAAMPARGGDRELEAAARRLTRLDRLVEPGTLYSRSDPGIGLAGVVLARAYGGSWVDLMDRFILPGLGMISASVDPAGAGAATPGHTASTGAHAPVVPVEPAPDSAIQLPLRGLRATGMDVAYLMAALMNDGRVAGEQRLQPGVVDAMLQPRAAVPGSRAEAALGLRVDRWEGRPHIGLVGGGPGHSLLVRMLPEERVGVAVLTNNSSGALPGVPEFVFRRLLGDVARARILASAGVPASGALGTDTAAAESDRAAAGAVRYASAPPVVHPSPDRLVGVYANGGEVLEIRADSGGVRLLSGPMALGVEPAEDGYVAVVEDGRPALRFQVLRDDAHTYLWLGERALVRDEPSSGS